MTPARMVGAVQPLPQVADQLVGDIFDAPPGQRRRVRRADVVAGPCHDVDAGPLGDLLEAVDVAREPDAGDLDDGGPPAAPEPLDLGRGELRIGLDQVVAAGHRMLVDPPEVLQRDGRLHERRVGRIGRLVEVRLKVEEQMLVHQGPPEAVRRDRPEDGHDFASARGLIASLAVLSNRRSGATLAGLHRQGLRHGSRLARRTTPETCSERGSAVRPPPFGNVRCVRTTALPAGVASPRSSRAAPATRAWRQCVRRLAASIYRGVASLPSSRNGPFGRSLSLHRARYIIRRVKR